MEEVKDSPAPAVNKHNTGKILHRCGETALRGFDKAPEARPPGAGPGVVPDQLPPRPSLSRADSRSAFPPPAQRQPAPSAQSPQPRPLFQPGGPVTNPPQFAPRPGTPAPRGTAPPAPQQQALRVQAPPTRPVAQQPFLPQQGQRSQTPNFGPQQRAPPPNNLQFGPRQPPQFGGGSTPDGSKPFIPQPINGVPRSAVPISSGPPLSQLSRQPSQGSIKALETSNALQNKQANLDNQGINIDSQNGVKSDALDMPGAPKSRSYSIAAPPGAPSPLKMDDDRRKSISVVGGRIDEQSSRNSGLGLIQEGKVESRDNVRGSKESVRSELPGDIPDRPESRLSSKMTESFIGTLPSSMIKKRPDDDDDVVLLNTTGGKNLITTKPTESTQNRVELSDRSPSLSRSEDSPEPRQQTPKNTDQPNKPEPTQNGTPEPQRPKIPTAVTSIESYNSSVKQVQKSPILDTKPPAGPVQKKPTELMTQAFDSRKSTPRKTASAPKYRTKDGDNDSGVDESTQGNELNGSPGSPNKKTPSKLPMKEKSNGSLKPSLSRSSSKSATAKTPENPLPAEKKKVPMNKIQVGNAPSPNIKAVKSKIGSLDNTTYKPGGGKVKIENRKLDFQNAAPKIAAKNDTYTPSGGTKKIPTTKLEWNAKSKVGSLDNTAYKPGGGDKKIESKKLDFKDKAKPKVASTVNISHKPGGGAVKIENQKLEFKAHSKVGSLDNVKHKPKGGDVKIFDDKEYIKQMSGQSPAPISRTESRQESPIPAMAAAQPKSDVNLNQQQ